MIKAAIVSVLMAGAASLGLALDPRKADAYGYNHTHSTEDSLTKSAEDFTSQGGWVSYKQCDPTWANQQLGYCSLTICQAGCAMSSVAMILSTKGVWKNPGQLDSWLTTNHGYANGCDIYWNSVDAFGVTKFVGIQNPTYSETCNGLSLGHGLVANVNNGGHWVLLTGCLGNNLYSVNDPGYSKTSYYHSEMVRLAVYH